MSTDYAPDVTAPELEALPGGHLVRSEVRRITTAGSSGGWLSWGSSATSGSW